MGGSILLRSIKSFRSWACINMFFLGFIIPGFININFINQGFADTTPPQESDRTAFDIAVFSSCQALENGKEKSVINKLLRSGIKPEIHYFDIFCPRGGLLLSSSFAYRNLPSAQYLLRYLRWRERETDNTEIRQIILNAEDANGETIVDQVKKQLAKISGIAKTIEIKSFLTLFEQHGGKCLKYCDP